jgi:hypothetical protein
MVFSLREHGLSAKRVKAPTLFKKMVPACEHALSDSLQDLLQPVFGLHLIAKNIPVIPRDWTMGIAGWTIDAVGIDEWGYPVIVLLQEGKPAPRNCFVHPDGNPFVMAMFYRNWLCGNWLSAHWSDKRFKEPVDTESDETMSEEPSNTETEETMKHEVLKAMHPPLIAAKIRMIFLAEDFEEEILHDLAELRLPNVEREIGQLFGYAMPDYLEVDFVRYEWTADNEISFQIAGLSDEKRSGRLIYIDRMGLDAEIPKQPGLGQNYSLPDQIQNFILSLGADVRRTVRHGGDHNFLLVYQRLKSFVALYLGEEHISLYLKPPEGFDAPESGFLKKIRLSESPRRVDLDDYFMEGLSGCVHYSPRFKENPESVSYLNKIGMREIIIWNIHDFERAKPLIEAAYWDDGSKLDSH